MYLGDFFNAFQLFKLLIICFLMDYGNSSDHKSVILILLCFLNFDLEVETPMFLNQSILLLFVFSSLKW